MVFRQTAPAEGDLLCESCGYILNGLDASARDGHCPECGEPLATSVDPTMRKPSPIETGWNASNFWRTTFSVLLRKRKFFRETSTRRSDPAVERFGIWHRVIAGVMFGLAATIHLIFIAETRPLAPQWDLKWTLIFAGIALLLIFCSVATLAGVTRLAVWMTTKESKWWGMRLPKPVLTRAMNFHAANYLPVGVAAVGITGGYRVLYELGLITAVAGVNYLVMLSVLVVVSAFWLFESFVIAMRRIRFANF